LVIASRRVWMDLFGSREMVEVPWGWRRRKVIKLDMEERKGKGVVDVGW
jgi:hypothetical protein